MHHRLLCRSASARSSFKAVSFRSGGTNSTTTIADRGSRPNLCVMHTSRRYHQTDTATPSSAVASPLKGSDDDPSIAATNPGGGDIVQGGRGAAQARRGHFVMENVASPLSHLPAPHSASGNSGPIAQNKLPQRASFRETAAALEAHYRSALMTPLTVDHLNTVTNSLRRRHMDPMDFQEAEFLHHNDPLYSGAPGDQRLAWPEGFLDDYRHYYDVTETSESTATENQADVDAPLMPAKISKRKDLATKSAISGAALTSSLPQMGAEDKKRRDERLQKEVDVVHRTYCMAVKEAVFKNTVASRFIIKGEVENVLPQPKPVILRQNQKSSMADASRSAQNSHSFTVQTCEPTVVTNQYHGGDDDDPLIFDAETIYDKEDMDEVLDHGYRRAALLDGCAEVALVTIIGQHHLNAATGNEKIREQLQLYAQWIEEYREKKRMMKSIWCMIEGDASLPPPDSGNTMAPKLPSRSPPQLVDALRTYLLARSREKEVEQQRIAEEDAEHDAEPIVLSVSQVNNYLAALWPATTSINPAHEASKPNNSIHSSYAPIVLRQAFDVLGAEVHRHYSHHRIPVLSSSALLTREAKHGHFLRAPPLLTISVVDTYHLIEAFTYLVWSFFDSPDAVEGADSDLEAHFHEHLKVLSGRVQKHGKEYREESDLLNYFESEIRPVLQQLQEKQRTLQNQTSTPGQASVQVLARRHKRQLYFLKATLWLEGEMLMRRKKYIRWIEQQHQHQQLTQEDSRRQAQIEQQRQNLTPTQQQELADVERKLLKLQEQRNAIMQSIEAHQQSQIKHQDVPKKLPVDSAAATDAQCKKNSSIIASQCAVPDGSEASHSIANLAPETLVTSIPINGEAGEACLINCDQLSRSNDNVLKVKAHQYWEAAALQFECYFHRICAVVRGCFGSAAFSASGGKEHVENKARAQDDALFEHIQHTLKEIYSFRSQLSLNMEVGDSAVHNLVDRILALCTSTAFLYQCQRLMNSFEHQQRIRELFDNLHHNLLSGLCSIGEEGSKQFVDVLVKSDGASLLPALSASSDAVSDQQRPMAVDESVLRQFLHSYRGVWSEIGNTRTTELLQKLFHTVESERCGVMQDLRGLTDHGVGVGDKTIRTSLDYNADLNVSIGLPPRESERMNELHNLIMETVINPYLELRSCDEICCRLRGSVAGGPDCLVGGASLPLQHYIEEESEGVLSFLARLLQREKKEGGFEMIKSDLQAVFDRIDAIDTRIQLSLSRTYCGETELRSQSTAWVLAEQMKLWVRATYAQYAAANAVRVFQSPAWWDRQRVKQLQQSILAHEQHTAESIIEKRAMEELQYFIACATEAGEMYYAFMQKYRNIIDSSQIVNTAEDDGDSSEDPSSYKYHLTRSLSLSKQNKVVSVPYFLLDLLIPMGRPSCLMFFSSDFDLAKRNATTTNSNTGEGTSEHAPFVAEALGGHCDAEKGWRINPNQVRVAGERELTQNLLIHRSPAAPWGLCVKWDGQWHVDNTDLCLYYHRTGQVSKLVQTSQSTLEALRACDALFAQHTTTCNALDTILEYLPPIFANQLTGTASNSPAAMRGLWLRYVGELHAIHAVVLHQWPTHRTKAIELGRMSRKYFDLAAAAIETVYQEKLLTKKWCDIAILHTKATSLKYFMPFISPSSATSRTLSLAEAREQHIAEVVQVCDDLWDVKDACCIRDAEVLNVNVGASLPFRTIPLIQAAALEAVEAYFSAAETEESNPTERLMNERHKQMATEGKMGLDPVTCRVLSSPVDLAASAAVAAWREAVLRWRTHFRPRSMEYHFLTLAAFCVRTVPNPAPPLTDNHDDGDEYDSYNVSAVITDHIQCIYDMGIPYRKSPLLCTVVSQCLRKLNQFAAYSPHLHDKQRVLGEFEKLSHASGLLDVDHEKLARAANDLRRHIADVTALQRGGGMGCGLPAMYIYGS